MTDAHKEAWQWLLVFLAGAVVVAVLLLGGIAGCGAYRGWQRGQARANARNQVQLTNIQASNQQQYARVIRAHRGVIREQAYQRWIESTGLKASQLEIAKTLTDRYLQFEAIKAEQAVATSGQNNTVVYVPSGAMGVPLTTLQAGKGK